MGQSIKGVQCCHDERPGNEELSFPFGVGAHDPRLGAGEDFSFQDHLCNVTGEDGFVEVRPRNSIPRLTTSPMGGPAVCCRSYEDPELNMRPMPGSGTYDDDPYGPEGPPPPCSGGPRTTSTPASSFMCAPEVNGLGGLGLARSNRSVANCDNGCAGGSTSSRCDAQCNRGVEQQNTPRMGRLEALSYQPTRFEETNTIDTGRSQARYSKVVVLSTKARTQRRPRAWEEWIRAAAAGRAVTLVEGVGDLDQSAVFAKLPAMYYVDRALTKLSVLPAAVAGETQAPAITVVLERIQVICPASDLILLVDQVDDKLDASEKVRAVFVQYGTDDDTRRRVCFLEESQSAQERCIQALTALWLERRNDHSMWF